MIRIVITFGRAVRRRPFPAWLTIPEDWDEPHPDALARAAADARDGGAR